ncbi:MAG TPA: lysoplasmalogenase [Clostridia bacterium]|nr:lysoplasmalogenase [Clostridia bacterium]
MNYLVYVVLALGILATLFFVYVRIKKGGVVAMLTKTLASVLFILTAVFAFIANKNIDSVYGLLIILGLVFGLIGDIVLDLKYCYPLDNDIYTFAGMGSFALGHICYLIAIYSNFYTGNLVTLLVPIAIAIVFSSVAIFGGPKLGMNYGKFKVPSLIYAFLLSFMLFTNVIFCIYSGTASRLFWVLMAIGGFMFIASDLALSQTYFVYKKVTDENGNEVQKLIYENKPGFVAFIHITYYAAQFLIAMSLFVY